MSRRIRTILDKIMQEAAALAQIVHQLDESAFLQSEITMRATCMTLINIGELVKNLDDDFRASHKHVPWRDIAGFRDVAAHGYFTLRMEEVWIYASKELPVLVAQIKDILDNKEQDDEIAD